MKPLLILNKWGKLFNNYSVLSMGDLSFVEMRGTTPIWKILRFWDWFSWTGSILLSAFLETFAM